MQKKMKVGQMPRFVKNVKEVSISNKSVFLWLEDGSSIQIYGKDICDLDYTKRK